MNVARELAAQKPGTHSTSHERLLRIVTAALLGLTIAYAIVLAFEVVLGPLDIFDEPIQILGAKAVAAGLTPHGDFWTDYPTLNYWILASAFKVFGSSYFVARFVSLAFYVLVLGAAWKLAPNWKAGAVLVVGLIVAIGRFYFYAPWNAVALLLIALLLFYCRGEDQPPVFWLLIGTLLALSLLIRVNFAAYGLVAIAASVTLDPARSLRTKTRQLVWLGLPVGLAVAAYIVICRNCLPAAYAQLIEFPMKILAVKRILHVLPWTVGLLTLPFLLPLWRMRANRKQLAGLLALLAGMALTLLWDLHRRRDLPSAGSVMIAGLAFIVLQAAFHKLTNGEFALLLCYLFCIHYYFARADAFHIWPAQLVLALLILLKLSQWPSHSRQRVEVGIMLLVALVGFAVQPSYHMLVLHDPPFSTFAAMHFASPRPSDLWFELNGGGDGELQALEYLQQHTAPSDYFYSGLLDHSRGYTDNLRSYVILQRPIPISDYEYEPGYSSEAPTQQRIISQLESTHTNWLLLWHGYRDENMVDRTSRGSSLLDDYIRRTYCKKAVAGDYQVWRRCSLVP